MSCSVKDGSFPHPRHLGWSPNSTFPGWGRLLLDRTLVSRGIAVSKITPLDRLAFVGKNGRGALMYEPVMESKIDLQKQLELDDRLMERPSAPSPLGEGWGEVKQSIFSLICHKQRSDAISSYRSKSILRSLHFVRDDVFFVF